MDVESLHYNCDCFTMLSEIVNSLLLTYLASEYLVEQDGRVKVTTPRGVGISYTNSGELSSSSSWPGKRRIVGILTILVLIVNVVDRVVGATDWIHGVLEWVGDARHNAVFSYLAIPLRVTMAATSYVLALYVDVDRRYLLGRLRLCWHRRTHAHRTATFQPSLLSSSSSLFMDESISTSDSNNNNNINPIPFVTVFLPYVGRAFVTILPAYPFMAVMISFCFMFIINIWEFLHLPLEWLNGPIYYGTLYGPFGWIYIHVKRQVQQQAMALPSW